MVTVTCNDNNCVNGGIDYNVLGAPLFVECGGCQIHLEPYNLRDDPLLPSMPAPPVSAPISQDGV
jgi:hypothetical protein